MTNNKINKLKNLIQVYTNTKNMTNNKQQTAVGGDFLPYELALELKQIGFDEPCFKYTYTGDTGNNVDIPCEVVPSSAKNHNEDDLCVSTPTYSQAFRWFREKHGLNSFVYHYGEDGILDTIYFAYNINDNLYASDFRTHEEAELECLKKLIEIVK